MNLNGLLKPIKKFFVKYWRKWTILAVLAIFIYIGLIFYKYIYVPIYQAKEIPSYKLEIKRSAFQGIMENYAKRQETIIRIINKDYPNPFK